MKVNELLVKVVISIGVLMKVKKIYEKMKIEKMILVNWVWEQFTGSRLDVFCMKVALKNFAKFTRKNLRQSLFFNNFIKRQTLAQVFFGEFCEFVRTSFL